jgi:hypothetical protein
MRTIGIIIVAALTACAAPRTEEPQAPQALQEPGVMDKVDEYSGRSGSGDLVEALFEEALKEDAVLRQLYADIDARARAHEDSTEQWRHFEQKNTQYYADARHHSTRITDTLARTDLQAHVDKSNAAYDANVTPARELDSAYARARSVVADLSTLVKVQRTLAMLERYQQEHGPLKATLQAELERIKALEVRLRAVVKE